MKSVYQEVNRLSRLVNDLLTLSRLDQGEELKIQPLKLIPFLNSIKNSAELLNQQSGKELKIELIHPSLDKEPQILAAPDQLNQVLYNIVDNAIKFSPPRGTIWLELLPEVSWEPATNQQITKEHPSVHSRKVIAKSEINQEYYTLIIKDQGEGISHQDLPHIFDRFFRSDASRSRQKGGNGLGLAIAKDLVEKQGGMIRVESNLGIGSSFYISLAKLS
jgi:signal transduction histidine kinase